MSADPVSSVTMVADAMRDASGAVIDESKTTMKALQGVVQQTSSLESSLMCTRKRKLNLTSTPVSMRSCPLLHTQPHLRFLGSQSPPVGHANSGGPDIQKVPPNRSPQKPIS